MIIVLCDVRTAKVKPILYVKVRVKGKAIPLQAWTDP
jgi:hypothetical protein